MRRKNGRSNGDLSENLVTISEIYDRFNYVQNVKIELLKVDFLDLLTNLSDIV